MKRHLNLIALIALVLGFVLLSGCGVKREELKFEGKEGTIVFNVKKDSGYKISTDSKDFRTSREQGVLLGKGFKIGIEFDDDYNYFFKSKFDNIKEKRKEYPEYKEVTYGEIKGIQYFYGGYNRYDIILPCGDSKEYFLSLYVYGSKDTEDEAKKAIANEEVLDVLNNIVSIKAAK